MVDLIVGTIGGRPFRVVVPDGWIGRVSVVADVRPDGTSRYLQTIKEEAHDPVVAPDQVTR